MIDTTDCKKTCWMVGAGAGLLVAAWLLIVGHYGFIAAVFLGLLTFGLFGSFLVWAFCDGAKLATSAQKTPAQTPVAKPAAPVAPTATATVKPAPTAPIAAAPIAAASVGSEAGVAAVVNDTPVQPMTGVADVPEAPDAPVDVPAKTNPVAAPKAVPATKPVAASVDEAAGTKPKGIKAPRKGGADDLKLIEGIGPKLEERLNEWGIFHYDQIAAWGPDEVAYADQNVPRFKGRATRDKWVAQAKLIVSEGIETFLERAKTNDY
jgi:NADH-quinone oxidoreductase subunit E